MWRKAGCNYRSMGNKQGLPTCIKYIKHIKHTSNISNTSNTSNTHQTYQTHQNTPKHIKTHQTHQTRKTVPCTRPTQRCLPSTNHTCRRHIYPERSITHQRQQTRYNALIYEKIKHTSAHFFRETTTVAI